jgi:hypothetical protein
VFSDIILRDPHPPLLAHLLLPEALDPAHILNRRCVSTHVPLKAPTGLRTGAAAMTVSCIRCEVWNERRRAAALLWAMVGRARAALRSAEGMREAMAVLFVGV